MASLHISMFCVAVSACDLCTTFFAKRLLHLGVATVTSLGFWSHAGESKTGVGSGLDTTTTNDMGLVGMTPS
jgi:hypothetical protein